ncbi:putative DCC family thiol-disulfide oxidoreductase YuxK [Caulobacter ginsengisoli]|uniref:DCC family thiol-disulfide oxidoreductase YuxK n=1 Tax=Caulobacter ginsengisoli TaxID=400775 RepID=A0ABU0ITZ5_9CAUL|nr:DCC1-like thiol-disulfide oxidoreductase family protein [Caulobacter ginsengisoli]MDQ0465475.1 putative DCC family thiol-disulfide oxidoreductase YuxK [Caulobacter ginsengisoli]
MADPLRPDGLMLFDGVCNLCTASVRIASRLDRAGVLRFTPIQSPYGQALARAHGIDPGAPSTFAFFEHGEPRLRSDGALALVGRTSWRWLGFLKLTPRPVRDAVYDWVAANRYRLFGRKDVCMIPTPELAARFVTERP